MLLGGRCYQCITGCSQCPNSVNICTQCSNGYMLSGGKCYPCVTGCSQCPNNINVCTQCFKGYLLSSGKCYPCSDSNCVLCPDNVSTCTQCFNGYTVSAGRCYPAASNFQSEWPNDYRYLYLCPASFLKTHSFSSQTKNLIILWKTSLLLQIKICFKLNKPVWVGSNHLKISLLIHIKNWLPLKYFCPILIKTFHPKNNIPDVRCRDFSSSLFSLSFYLFLASCIFFFFTLTASFLCPHASELIGRIIIFCYLSGISFKFHYYY